MSKGIKFDDLGGIRFSNYQSAVDYSFMFHKNKGAEAVLSKADSIYSKEIDKRLYADKLRRDQIHALARIRQSDEREQIRLLKENKENSRQYKTFQQRKKKADSYYNKYWSRRITDARLERSVSVVSLLFLMAFLSFVMGSYTVLTVPVSVGSHVYYYKMIQPDSALNIGNRSIAFIVSVIQSVGQVGNSLRSIIVTDQGLFSGTLLNIFSSIVLFIANTLTYVLNLIKILMDKLIHMVDNLPSWLGGS